MKFYDDETGKLIELVGYKDTMSPFISNKKSKLADGVDARFKKLLNVKLVIHYKKPVDKDENRIEKIKYYE